MASTVSLRPHGSTRIVALGLAIALSMTGIAAFSPPSASASNAENSPLRTHLTNSRQRLQQLQTQPATAITLKASVTAESRSGVRRLRIGEYQYLSDSDRDFAGYSLGAGSWDTGVGVLASAVADEFVLQAARAGIALDAVDVIVTSHPDAPEQERQHKVAYPRNLAYVAWLDSPASEQQLDTLRQTVNRESAALNLITEAQPVGHGEVVLTTSPAQRDPNLPPGLRDFLIEKRQAILRKQQAGADAPYSLRAHARIEPRSGLRDVRTGTRGFQFIHDRTPALGGLGLGPTAEEHLLGVLGTCLTHVTEIQAATRQVVLDALEIRLQSTLSPRVGQGITSPSRYGDIRYSVHVESPASRSDIDGLRDAVEATCPVYNLLKDPQTIQSRVVRGRYTGGTSS